MLALETTPMSDIIHALASGRVTATALTKGYLARIEAYDRDGPMLNSVRDLNADALTIAAKLDNSKPSAEQPLAGVPILVKDNIATGDKQSTTAGSLALEGARAMGDLSEREYKSARAMDLLAAKTRGMDAYMNQHKLDAVLFPGSAGAAIAAKAGYPSVMVPGGFISGSDGKDTPDYPFGVTFAGRAWGEHKAAASGLRLRAGLQHA